MSIRSIIKEISNNDNLSELYKESLSAFLTHYVQPILHENDELKERLNNIKNQQNKQNSNLYTCDECKYINSDDNLHCCYECSIQLCSICIKKYLSPKLLSFSKCSKCNCEFCPDCINEHECSA
jgi:hypothetical protein